LVDGDRGALLLTPVGVDVLSFIVKIQFGVNRFVRAI
jgi:hypothetical protein